jgi:hypothetical protein
MRFVVDKVALGQVFLQVLLLSPFSVIPAIVHTPLRLYGAVIRRKRGKEWVPSIKQGCFVTQGTLDRKALSPCGYRVDFIEVSFKARNFTSQCHCFSWQNEFAQVDMFVSCCSGADVTFRIAVKVAITDAFR